MIVPFPDFNNLQPLMPEEIQEEDLLGWVPADNNALKPPQQFNHHLQMGFVQLREPRVDPV